MAVSIRMKRMGSSKRPHFRIVVADQRSPRDGRFIEELGYYQPRTEPTEMKLNAERVQYWVSKGAQPTVSVKNIMKKLGITTS